MNTEEQITQHRLRILWGTFYDNRGKKKQVTWQAPDVKLSSGMDADKDARGQLP